MMPANLSRPISVYAILTWSVACSAEGAGSAGAADGPPPAASGGTSPSVTVPVASTGGLGGAEGEVENEVTHPLFGAGNYPNTPPTDPCIVAQHWEENTNLDMTTGALILESGVVYEVTGVGKGESTWADEWTSPPCTRDDGHCDDLSYQVVVVCD